jgi:diaminopimelate decarboxylase
VKLRTLDIGGGLGIPYNQEDPPSPAEYGQAIREAMSAFAGLNLTLICEPGRVIVGNAGVLLTKTLYLKQGEIKNFVIVDAAMNDLIRPAFYDSYHAIWPVRKRLGESSYIADVVGPICETGDFLARDRALAHQPSEGELMAVMSAGAYGFTMASNYNTRPRGAEVMVRGDKMAVVRKREELDELVRNEAVPGFVG